MHYEQIQITVILYCAAYNIHNVFHSVLKDKSEKQKVKNAIVTVIIGDSYVS